MAAGRGGLSDRGAGSWRRAGVKCHSPSREAEGQGALQSSQKSGIITFTPCLITIVFVLATHFFYTLCVSNGGLFTFGHLQSVSLDSSMPPCLLAVTKPEQ